jgi:hypothetical protein
MMDAIDTWTWQEKFPQRAHFPRPLVRYLLWESRPLVVSNDEQIPDTAADNAPRKQRLTRTRKRRQHGAGRTRLVFLNI